MKSHEPPIPKLHSSSEVYLLPELSRRLDLLQTLLSSTVYSHESSWSEGALYGVVNELKVKGSETGNFRVKSTVESVDQSILIQMIEDTLKPNELLVAS